MDIKFNIERTVVKTRIRVLRTTWNMAPAQVSEFVWKLHKKSSLILDRARYMANDDMDDYLEQVQAWCQETGNGRRTSYDTFHFGRPAKMTAFLLRWNNG